MSRLPALPPSSGTEPARSPHVERERATAGRSPLWLAVHLHRADAITPECVQNGLAALAAAALELTPVVSVEPPDDLLLEIGGSLRLYGGLSPVRQVLADKLDDLALGFHWAVAPTASASLWLARAAAADVLELDRLTDRLALLPLIVTGWPEQTVTRLAAMGVRTIGDCLRLPRDGFARRIGRDCLTDLDRALGKDRDLRTTFATPESISLRVELAAQTTRLELIEAAAGGLLEELAAILRRRQVQVHSLVLEFDHDRHPTTQTEWRLIVPVSRLSGLRLLVRDRLERFSWPAPVVALTLRTGSLQPGHYQDMRLFDRRAGAQDPDTAAQNLIERLTGCFGTDRVHGLGLAADHRPERAWISIGGDALHQRGVTTVPVAAAARPLWMLVSPRRLRDIRPMSFLSGPERIAGGWWDGADIDREYYTVRSGYGDLLWIYRERRAADAWYLHGFFG